MNKKLNILIVTYFFPPQNAIAAQRPLSWAKYWSRDGHDVDVLTTPKDFYGESIYNENYKVHEVEISEIYNKLRNWYHKNFKKEVSSSPTVDNNKKSSQFKKWLLSRGLSTSTRMPDPSDLWIANALSWAKSQNKKWDIVISTFGPYSTHIIAQNLRVSGYAKKWCADYRDFWTDSEIYPGLPIIRNIEALLEKTLMRDADIISLDSESKVAYFKQKYRNRIILVPNGFDAEEIDNLPKEKFNFNTDKKIISYTGSIYPGLRDPKTLFDYIRKNSAFEFEVHFFGQNVEILKREIIDIQDKVKIHGMVEREDALRIQRDSDILLYLESEKNNLEGVIPGKLYEYIYSRTPILAVGISDKGNAGMLIKKNGGICQIEELNKLRVKSSVDESVLQYSREKIAKSLLRELTP